MELKRKKKIEQITLWGSFSNLILLVFKFAAGILGHSSAMIADAVHSLSDFVTDVIVLLFLRISSKPQDSNHDYGHGKYETLATTIIGLFLFSVGIGLLYEGGEKIYQSVVLHKPLTAPSMIAFYAALVSIAIKEILFRVTLNVGLKYESSVVIANAWHHRSDALSSIGTALGIGGAALLGPQWHILDPLAAFIVSLFIIKVALGLILPALNELLEKSLSDDIEQEILNIVLESKEVCCPHNLRTRSIGNRIAIELHIRVKEDMTVAEAHDITLEIEEKIRERFGPHTHISLHVEPVK